MITSSINSPYTDASRAFSLARSHARSRSVRIIGFALLLLQSSCATITTPSGNELRRSSPEFRDYAREVFQRQNATLVSMFDVFEYANDAYITELDFAEQRMIERCAALNNAASARRDGKTLDITALRRVADTIVACDTATLEAEQLIGRIQASELQN